MGTQPREVRCRSCRILLAKIDGGAITIRRNDIEATFDGDLRASILCYRPRCGTVNVLTLPAASPTTT